jgi:hypothetical protein
LTFNAARRWEKHIGNVERDLADQLSLQLSALDDVTFASDFDQVWIRVHELDARFGPGPLLT